MSFSSYLALDSSQRVGVTRRVTDKASQDSFLGPFRCMQCGGIFSKMLLRNS